MIVLLFRPSQGNPVHRRTNRREDHRQQRDRDQDADQRNDHSADPHAPEEGERHGDQGHQSDADRGAAEDHRVPGRFHRPLHGDIVRDPGVPLLAPALDDQQGVIHRDTKADERDEELNDDADIHERRQDADDEERREDGDRRDDERHQGQCGAEDVEQHHQRPQATDERFHQHAGVLALAAVARLDHRTARHQHRLASHGVPRDGGHHRVLPGQAFAERRQENERERGALIVREEDRISSGTVGNDPRRRLGGDDAFLDGHPFIFDGGRVERGALRQGRDQHEWGR